MGTVIVTVDDFRKSLTAAEPPARLSPALVGLWWDAKGDLKRAHESAQRDEGPKAPMGVGFMPTCIATRAIRATHPILRSDGQACVLGSHWMRNGPAS